MVCISTRGVLVSIFFYFLHPFLFLFLSNGEVFIDLRGEKHLYVTERGIPWAKNTYTVTYSFDSIRTRPMFKAIPRFHTISNCHRFRKSRRGEAFIYLSILNNRLFDFFLPSLDFLDCLVESNLIKKEIINKTLKMFTNDKSNPKKIQLFLWIHSIFLNLVCFNLNLKFLLLR